MKNSAGKNMPAQPFAVKDCALAAIATGRRAQNLRELRDNLLTIHPGSIYYHFWGGLLRPRFVDPEYNNDFAIWSCQALRDVKLAERLGVIDPIDFPDLEALRQELVEVVEERLDELEMVPWSKPDQQFYFIRSQIVVFDTRVRLSSPPELAEAVPRMSVGSIFYHFIDARRRTPGNSDDFRTWLSGWGEEYGQLCRRLAGLDPSFFTLTEMRQQLASIFREFFG